ncbi:DUF1481 domain-containing protein [Shigella flexneri]
MLRRALACDGTDRDHLQGQTIKPDLDSQAIARIEHRRAALLLMSAWHRWKRRRFAITVVANSDFCRWQPDEKTF